LKYGNWSYITFPGKVGNGRGVAVDDRAPVPSAWVGIDSAPGAIGRIPIDIADGTQTLPPGAVTSASPLRGDGTVGVGVDNGRDLWAVNQTDSSLTHYAVTGSTVMAADRVELVDNPALDPSQYPQPNSYSDFTGFAVRGLAGSRGFYRWRQAGCAVGKTRWLAVRFDADTPAGTRLTIKVRTADDPGALAQASWSAPYAASPADLSAPAPGIMPNPATWIEVELDLTAMDRSSTPRLKGVEILFECDHTVR
jgi:hypothetical protein